MYLIILAPEIYAEFTNNCQFDRGPADIRNFSKLLHAANDVPLVGKRKPGRPRKAIETAIPLVKKRKPGRPRKAKETVIPLIAKRKSGRPRKAKETVIPVVEKRKPGRPRKITSVL